ncbi:hypothetical protein MPER_02027, partial [Moniliophthora perniciosa FA553]
YNAIHASPAAFLDGRISNTWTAIPTVAPPIELYHRAFHDYIANANTISPDLPDEVVLGTRILMGSASLIRTGENPQRTPRHEEGAPVFIQVDPESGSSNVDPSIQVEFSYAKYYCQPNVTGSSFAIMGGVITAQTIVQRLSSYLWLGTSRIQDDEYVITIAQNLFALQVKFDYLKPLEDDPTCVVFLAK